MSVLTEHVLQPAPGCARTPAHRARGARRAPVTVATALGIAVLVLAVTALAAWVLGTPGGCAGFACATAAVLLVRRLHELAAWHRELDASFGVHERKALNLSRVL